MLSFGWHFDVESSSSSSSCCCDEAVHSMNVGNQGRLDTVHKQSWSCMFSAVLGACCLVGLDKRLSLREYHLLCVSCSLHWHAIKCHSWLKPA
jgi:hypothetical protein